eukprot:TRINITY_DN14423_c0_g1_i1.p1 TRINITY_DN14423_c0_g1~~TRINITY_DN14423_c0_g1_i1.p1  ORF type:complete len:432 (+),score=72.03 TRINITY_DN14423_c0_g1_i1:115-1410(+)
MQMRPAVHPSRPQGLKTASKAVFRPNIAFQAPTCRNGHQLSITICRVSAQICDCCGKTVRSTFTHRCGFCDYDLCSRCFETAELSEDGDGEPAEMQPFLDDETTTDADSLEAVPNWRRPSSSLSWERAASPLSREVSSTTPPHVTTVWDSAGEGVHSVAPLPFSSPSYLSSKLPTPRRALVPASRVSSVAPTSVDTKGEAATWAAQRGGLAKARNVYSVDPLRPRRRTPLVNGGVVMKLSGCAGEKGCHSVGRKGMCSSSGSGGSGCSSRDANVASVVDVAAFDCRQGRGSVNQVRVASSSDDTNSVDVVLSDATNSRTVTESGAADGRVGNASAARGCGTSVVQGRQVTSSYPPSSRTCTVPKEEKWSLDVLEQVMLSAATRSCRSTPRPRSISGGAAGHAFMWIPAEPMQLAKDQSVLEGSIRRPLWAL